MHGKFQKVALLKISRSPHLTGVAASNPTKKELVTKVLKGPLILTENFQEVISNGVHYQKFTDLQIAAFSLACF